MAEEPVGHERPTDEELLRTYGLAKRDYSYEGPIDDWPKRAERAAVVAGLRAVLAHWGAAVGEVADPALRPIPVSERPWERQDWCNKDGRCWFGWADEPDASWSFCKPSERDTATVSLPADALPLPMEEIERRLRMDGPAGHERPTDEQLDDLFVEIDGSGETQSWRAFARAVLARWGAADGEAVELPPRPPLMQPPAHLALERYGVTWDGSSDKPLLTRMADGYWTPWHVAAELLAQPEPAPAADGEVAELLAALRAAAECVADEQPDLMQLTDEQLTRAADPLERQALRPIPASERLPGPGDCLPWPGEPDETPWCWAFVKGPLGDDAWERRPVSCLTTFKPMHTHWLAAHDLPLPEFD